MKPEEKNPVSVRCHALLPSAGVGARAGTVPRIASVNVVVTAGDQTLRLANAHWHLIEKGGATRADSVFNGLTHLLESGAASADDWVLVHDAARCLISPQQIDALIDACLVDDVGGLLALPLPDTLKLAVDGRSGATIPRSDKWLAQTPQMFRAGVLHAALAAHAKSGFAEITDEASAIEAAGLKPLLVPGSAQNFKVTYPEDFALAEAVLLQRLKSSETL